mgnify:CR=1 FL=1|tara:strand:- start:54108 stop:55133 length:1026 start_codon:yes stop_codon:yes gene_type:complete
MKKAFIISSLLAPIFASIFLAIHFSIIFFSPYAGENTTFTVRPGEGFAKVNGRLAQKNLISDARLFHYYAKYTDKMTKIKAGTYEINNGMHMGEILDTLVDGVPILTSVTIPEGKNMYEIGKILEENKITSYKDFIKECRDQENIALINAEAPSVEGYLFPDTYKFAKETPAREVVRAMINLFNQKVADLDFSQANLNKHEVIILASIVEKETGAKFERPTIAGVYLNRLAKNMRLQADPTTIYGIWENYNGNLKKKHLLQKTDYNTYKMAGLPLGPIASPSLAAIKAVLKPKDHNFIYFVSKNDGTHVFTPTYKEHLKAVEYWQKNYRNRKGKSWRDLKQ